MGLFGKKEAAAPVVEEIQEEIEEVVVQKPAGTVIAPGMTFEGDFDTDEQMDIRGTVHGSIRSSVDTHIAKTGIHTGKMTVNSLHSEGVMNSDVVCADLASFSKDARFTGVLTTENFDADHGCNFEGTLSIKHTAPAAASSESPEQDNALESVIDSDDLPVTEEDIFGKA